MKKDSDESLAMHVADGDPPTWPDQRTPRVQALESVYKIANAFRQAGQPAETDTRPVLFHWRHLSVIEKLGAGSFGEVYRAYDPGLRRDVALKLAKQGDKSRAARELTASEARRMARLRHPNILAVHGVAAEEGRIGIWADLLNGETLESLLGREGTLPHEQVLNIALDLADALVLMHRRSVVHGDIKGSNIMVQRDGSPVIMDFGSAGDPNGVSPRAGSPLYMAPEQLAGSPASPAGDTYALGVMLFRMLAGDYPISAKTLDGLIAAHQLDREVATDLIPREWRSLVGRCLARDAARRPSAESVRDELRAIQRAPAVRRKRWAVAAALAALALALAVTSYGLVRATRAEREATSQARQTEAAFEFLAGMLQSPRTDSTEVRVRDVLEKAELELDGKQLVVDEEARLRWVLGRTYGSLGLYEQGFEQLDKATELATDPRVRLATWVSQADYSVDAEDIPRLRSVLGRFEEIYEVLPPELRYARWFVPMFEADIAHLEGRYEEAERLLKEVENADTPFPPDHAANRELWRDLATLAGRRGDLGSARIYIEKALDWLSRHDERNVNAILAVRNDLATIQCRSRDYAACEQTARDNLAELSRARPDDVQARIVVRNVLAVALGEQGEHDAAIDLLRQVVADAEENLGPNHQFTILAIGNVGAREYGRGHYEEAERWSRSALEKMAAAEGPDSANALMFEYNVAEAVLWQGNLPAALELARSNYERCTRILGADHYFANVAADLYGIALTRNGDPQAALMLLDETLARKSDLYGAEDPRRWDTEAARAEALLALGDHRQALALAQAVQAHRRTALSPTDSRVQQIDALVRAAERAAAN